MTKKICVLDAGHGGRDGGAVGVGLIEKNLVLDIVERTAAILKAQYAGVDVKLTRSQDEYLTLEQRAKIANDAKADLFVSVHINSAENTAAHGFESYIYQHAGSSTIAFHNVMHAAIVKQIKGRFVDRGKKRANFAVLRLTNMSAILTECGFIRNPNDSGYLKETSFIQALAKGHAEGIAEFLGLERKTEPAAAAPVRPKLHRVQVGAFEDKDAAEKVRNDLIKLGYKDAYVKYE